MVEPPYIPNSGSECISSQASSDIKPCPLKVDYSNNLYSTVLLCPNIHKTCVFCLYFMFTKGQVISKRNFDVIVLPREKDITHCYLSGHVPEIQAEVEVVKIKNPDFSCWA